MTTILFQEISFNSPNFVHFLILIIIFLIKISKNYKVVKARKKEQEIFKFMSCVSEMEEWLLILRRRPNIQVY